MNNSDNEENNVGRNKQQNSAASERLHDISRRGLNAATGGAFNKVRNAPVLGAAARKVEDKVADKLGKTKLGQKLASHQKPNLGVSSENTENQASNPQNGDVGSRNLRSSLANRAKNLWEQRKNKKNRDDDKEESNESSENSEEEKKDDDSEDTLSPAEEKAIIKRQLYIKLAILGSAAFLLYFLVMTVASALTGGGVFKVAPISSYKEYGTDSFQSVTPEDSAIHKDEIEFYKKIKEVVNANNEEVNVNYVVAILLEVFYEYDASYEYPSNEEAKKLLESGGIDYDKMTKNIDSFVNIIKNTNSTDYEINGEIYNALKNSDEFKEYYRDALKMKNKTIDDILNNVFELAQELDVYDEYDDTVMTTETDVTVNTGNKKQTMSINEYMSSSVYASTDKLSSPEVVKAYTIVYSTNIAAVNKKLTINSNNATATNSLCNVKEGCSYDNNGNLVNGFGERNSTNTVYYNGNYYYRKPLSNSEQKDLTKNINTTFGNVLVDSDGSYPTLDVSKLDGFGDGDYKTIIKNAYEKEYKYKNIGENSYVLDASYGDKKVLTSVIFYDQKDYSNQFCGIKGYTIGGSGCGVTAMAIVASTYENNRKYDPIYMNSEARKRGMCGSTGTAQAFFGKEASVLKYKYVGGSKYNKNVLNLTLKHLSQGDLVVVRMGAGHFTGGGHYMVLGGVDPETKKVYVYDPNNRSNSSYRKTGNGWYSFNDIIVKEAYNFYVIWKG